MSVNFAFLRAYMRLPSACSMATLAICIACTACGVQKATSDIKDASGNIKDASGNVKQAADRVKEGAAQLSDGLAKFDPAGINRLLADNAQLRAQLESISDKYRIATSSAGMIILSTERVEAL